MTLPIGRSRIEVPAVDRSQIISRRPTRPRNFSSTSSKPVHGGCHCWWLIIKAPRRVFLSCPCYRDPERRWLRVVGLAFGGIAVFRSGRRILTPRVPVLTREMSCLLTGTWISHPPVYARSFRNILNTQCTNAYFSYPEIELEHCTSTRTTFTFCLWGKHL